MARRAVKELRFHGRREPRYDRVAPFIAAPRLLAEAALREGQYVQFRPPWLFLRGLVPEAALLRVDREPIETYQQEAFLDAVIVTDATILGEINTVAGLKPGGLLLVNSAGPIPATPPAKVVARDLSGLARRHKADLTPALVGAVAALTGVVRLETAEHLLKGAGGKDRLVRANLAALHAAFADSQGA